MSIEDINYLRGNSIKQTMVVLIDSKTRDFEVYPDPNYYSINFNTPFKNVIGFDIIDTSVPRTMYSVDKYNNLLYYYIHTDTSITMDDFIKNEINVDAIKYDPTYNGKFKLFEMTPGDYSLPTFIEYFNEEIKKSINNKAVLLEASGITQPTELTDVIQFNCNFPFIFNMYDSTLAETLGFNLLIKKELHNLKYSFYDKLATKKQILDENNNLLKYSNTLQSLRLYISFFDNSDEYYNKYKVDIRFQHHLISPGMVCFTGEKYIVLRSPEIEEYSFGSLSYTNNNLGIAKLRTNSLGFNDEKLYITKIPIREFHPVGKLSKLSFRFETTQGFLYDFKGVNHNLTIAIYYFEPKFKNDKFNSILNPNYTINFNDYKYTNAEQEIINENDDDEDDIVNNVNENFSRDNVNIYRKMEQKYNYGL
jgi:hypothetical protein